MAGHFSAQKQFHLKPTPRSDRWALVRNKQITPGEVRAGLLLPEASCSWSLPFPSSPGIASNLCPGRDVLSRAVPPMLVVQSLASSHVSMVIVAGDPLTATNSKKREEKKKKS